MNSEASVNIIIKATDGATAVIKTAGNMVNDLAAKTGALSASLLDMSGIIGVTVWMSLSKVIQQLQLIGQAFNMVKAVSQLDIVQTAIARVRDSADDMLNSMTQLSSSLGSVGSVAGPLLAGFTGLGKVTEVLGTQLKSALGPNLATSVQQSFSKVLDTTDTVLLKIMEKAERIPKKIEGVVGGVKSVSTAMAGIGEPLELFEGLQHAVTGSIGAVSGFLGKLSFAQEGFNTLKSLVVGGPFDILIGQNVRLREQLLATQSSLVATNKIIVNGMQIKDPTTAIQALTGSVNDAISRIRQGSLALVGVTSGQLVEAFQIVAGQASNIGISLSQASDLTLSFAATMGTLGIPLFQARQEITSIASGTIDMNSVLAKSLGITNQMVMSWKANGTVFEKLTSRMEAFKAGNALAAQTISGVSSNVEEIFQEIGRRAGAPLLDPIVAVMNQFYVYLQENTQALSDTIGSLVKTVFDAGLSLLGSFTNLYQTLAPLLAQLPAYLFESLANFLKTFGEAIDFVVPLIQPLVNIMTTFAHQIMAIGGPFLKIALQATVLKAAVGGLTSGFGTLFKIMPGLGDVLFFMSGRTSGLFKTFTSLSGAVGFGAAGFLTLGKNLGSISPLMGLISGKLGMFGPMITKMIPGFAGVASQVAVLSKNYSGVKEMITSFIQQGHASLGTLAKVASTSTFAGGAFQGMAKHIAGASTAMKPYIDNINNASFFNTKFAETAKLAGIAGRQFLTNLGLFTVAGFAAIVIIDKLIVNNKNFTRTLTELQKKIGEIGGAIWSFLTNPFVVATGIIVGLGIAIKGGLIPQIMQMGQVFAGSATTAIEGFWQKGTQGVASFSKGIRESAINVSELFDGQYKRQTKAFKSSLDSQSEAYESSMAQRSARMEEINQQMEQSNTPLGENEAPRASNPDLVNEKQALQAEMDEATATRQAQVNKLAAMEANVYNKELPKGTAALKANLAEQSVAYEEAIVARQAQIESLSQEIEQANLTDRAPQENPFAEAPQDTSHLQEQKRAAMADLAEMQATRAEQVATLGVMQADLANLAPPPTVGERFSALGTTIKTQAVGSFEMLKTSAKGMSWSGMVNGLGSVKNGAIAAGTALKANLIGSFKTIMADIGPMVLMVAAIFAITQAVGTYTTLMDASTKSSQDFAAATQEATTKLNLLLDAQQKKSAIDTGKDRAEERLEEIKKEQGFIGGFMEFLRNAVNLVSKVVFSLLNPFIWVRNAAWLFGKALSAIGNGLKSMPVIGNLIQGIEGLGNAMGQALAPVKAFFQPVLDLLGRFGDGVKTVWDFLSQPPQLNQSGAESQLNGEIEGYSKTMEDAQAKLEKMSKSTDQVTADRKKLMELNNAQAAARAKGDDDAVASIQKDIDKTKEVLDARKAEADAVIKGLESQKAPTEAHKKAQAQLIDQAKELKRSWEDNAIIKPPDLADLGSAYDQISSKASSAVTSVKKMLDENSGAADQLKSKAQEILDTTAQQQQMGLITSEEAIARYRMLASSTKLDADVQMKAQQAITEAYKTEGDKRVAEVERHQSEIEVLTSKGTIGEAEGERQLTAEKKKELEIRLENLRIAHNEEQEIRYQNFQTDLSSQDDLIAAANEKLKTPGIKPKDAKDQTDAIEAANQKKLDLQTGYESASTFSATKFGNESQKITTDLAKNEADTLKHTNDEKLKNFDEAQTALDGLKAQGLKTDEEYAKESKKNNDSRFAEELSQIAEQREKLDPKDKEGLEALATKEAEVRKKMADSRGEYYDKMEQAAQNDAQEELASLEGLKAQGLKTDEEFAQGSLDITRKRLETELGLLEEQKKLLNPKDEEGLQKIAAKESAIQKQIADSRNTFYEQMITAAKKDAEERTAILEGQKVAGLISENDYNQKSFDLTTEALDKEQALLEKKKGELKAGDEEGQEAIAAQEGDIQKRRLEATKNFYQKQLAVSERARQKLLDAATEAETESQIQIQGLLNSGAIKQEQAEGLKLNATEKRIHEELRLEEQKLAELSAMPAYSDPEAEDERQKQIRASRQRTHELTLQIAENESARQEKIRAQQEKAMDRQAQRAANDAEAQSQSLSDQAGDIDNINHSLDLQNKILESGKAYLEARHGLMATELDVLSKLTKSGSEQKDLAKLKASIEIRVLDIKQQGELAALKLQQQQTANALKREEIENRIAQIKNQAEVAQKTVNLQKVALNPNATAEERQLAQLDLQASLQTGSGLRDAGMLIGDQQAAQTGMDRNQLAAMQLQHRGQDISARGALVDTLQGSERRAATEALRRQVLGDLGLGYGTGGIRGAAQTLTNQTLNSALGLGDGRANPSDRTSGNFRFETPNGVIPTRAAPRRTRFDERAEDQAASPAPAPRRSFNERYEDQAPTPSSLRQNASNVEAAIRTGMENLQSRPPTTTQNASNVEAAIRTGMENLQSRPPTTTLPPPVNLTAQGRSPDFSAVTAGNEKLVTAMTGLKTAFDAFGKINFTQSNEINNNFGSGATPARETDRVLSALYDVATKIRQSR